MLAVVALVVACVSLVVIACAAVLVALSVRRASRIVQRTSKAIVRPAVRYFRTAGKAARKGISRKVEEDAFLEEIGELTGNAGRAAQARKFEDAPRITNGASGGDGVSADAE